MTELLARALPSHSVTLQPTLDRATSALNAWVEVDLGAAAANVAALRATLGRRVEIIAVVKANAYGAGLGLVPALAAADVDRFAVVWASEAIALRRLGVRRPILVLGHCFPADADSLVEHDITVTVDTLELGQALSAAAVRAGRAAKVHIHIDSGLHRDGLAPDESVALAGRLRALPALDLEGLSTHMANADEPDDAFSAGQHQVFGEVVRRLPWIRYRHSANTATALRHGEFRFEGVRVGLALHGVLPQNTPGSQLRPILSVHARVARVADVAVGEGVSYGLTWRAAVPSRVALIPVGYADGWRRNLGNRGAVLVAGRRCPMVGRVCMDQFLVDVTALPAVLPGDEAVLLGSQGPEEITADEVAEAAGTIPWDIFASLQARLPRLYHRAGRVEQVVGA